MAHTGTTPTTQGRRPAPAGGAPAPEGVARARAWEEEAIDQDGKDSFPASDPPAHWQGHAT
ncbi:MAG: hypothetical protein ACRDYY_08890 [Acidimicrobiales bacterium]